LKGFDWCKTISSMVVSRQNQCFAPATRIANLRPEGKCCLSQEGMLMQLRRLPGAESDAGIDRLESTAVDAPQMDIWYIIGDNLGRLSQ
jgi:hypothetical protein